MMSASEVRNVLDAIAAEVGIQKIDEMDCGKIHNVFYLMLDSDSYFMNFRWHDSGSWNIKVADEIKNCSRIWTTGNITIYPNAFDDFAINMIKNQLNDLISNYNKALKDMKRKKKDQKMKEILTAGGRYDV